MSTNKYSVAWITVPTQEVATKISSGLVEHKLAACVNIIPKIQSVYWWEGSIQKDEEMLLMLKTKTVLIPEIIDWVKKNHPYSVPEGEQPFPKFSSNRDSRIGTDRERKPGLS
jgi:periplasmic divalent cation tolerance protein